jgi:L-lactate dehydrogenase complex protein LldG
MSARDEVLARIRRANAVAARDPAAPPIPGPPDGPPSPESAARRGIPAPPGPAQPLPAPLAYRERGDRTAAELMDLLARRLADYRARVVRTTAAGVPNEVAAALHRRGARRIVVPAGVSLPGLPTAAALAAIVPDIETVPDHGLSPPQLDRFDGAVTGAAVAIAETGTIVLDAAAPDQGRRAISLVPDYHLCVVGAGQVVELVPEAVARLAGAVLAGSVAAGSGTLTWISGPSATSDIELERVEGVHGPRTLEVILVDG